jgi:hypothetical protein
MRHHEFNNNEINRYILLGKDPDPVWVERSDPDQVQN